MKNYAECELWEKYHVCGGGVGKDLQNKVATAHIKSI